MNVKIQKQDLEKLLLLTQSIIEKRTTMPILSNVLLSAGDGVLKVSATDLEITTTTSAQAEVSTPGSTTVSGRVLAGIVHELPDSMISLDVTEGERVEIKCGKSKLKVIGASAEEYPSLPGIAFDPRGTIPANQLLEMVNKTIYSVSQDEARFNLSGVNFTLESSGKEQNLKMVATDGHRLALVTRPVKDLSFDQGTSHIVPRKGLNEIRKILSDAGSNPVGVDIREGFFVIDAGTTRVSMRLIDGEFPDYQQVLPNAPGNKALVNANDFCQSIRRASLLVTEKAKCVKLDFAPGTLRLSSSSPELGESTDELELTYKGDPLTVAFNARYLLEVAATLVQEGNLCIELLGDVGPGKFYAEGDESCFGIVMPMRLN